MSKPDWCPQGLWDDTGMAFDQLYDAEPDLEANCEQGIREYAARLAIAAEQRERDELFENMSSLRWDMKDATAAEVLDAAAAAIRKRGEI